jgi:hypothetical protein
MSHVFKKSEKKKVTTPPYASVHQKIARRNSGNTITAQALLRKLEKQDKEKVDGAKRK